MNIDERLERLAERTDGLTHSVELLAGMQIETEKRMVDLIERSSKLQDNVATLARWNGAINPHRR